MTITVIGVAGSMDVTEFSRLMRRAGDALTSEEVATGLQVSVATGTRVVSVSAGESVQAGTLLTSDAAQTVTLAANTSGLSRVDLIIAEIRWTNNGTATNETNAGNIVALTGTPAANPVAPNLTSASRNPGVIWRVPLAKVTVTNGAGQLAAGNVADARPLHSNIGSGTSVTIAPPGAWSVPGASPWQVQRYDNTVYMSGRLTRTTADIAQGVEAVFGGAQLIPTGYRPNIVVSAAAMPDSGNNILGHFTILTDGTVTYSQNFGSFPANGTLRVVNTSWRTDE